VAKALSAMLGLRVDKLDDCVGEQLKQKIQTSAAKVILLENLRFHPEEEKGDEKFAKELACLADIYVNDAFGTAHRAHASTAIVAKFLPACLGFLMEKEVKYLSSALNPKKPYVVILGGAKVSDKIDVISSLTKSADKFLIGGAMAYTFLKSQGVEVGNSRVEAEKLQLAKNILQMAEKQGIKIVRPIDHLVIDNLDNPTLKKITEASAIPLGFLGVDIGPQTIAFFKKELQGAKTVLWNGPLGIFEKNDYAKGTKEIAQALTVLKNATVIVGGGDSASAAKKFGVADKLAHVSTGGGASLEFLEGKELPGIAIIPDKK
jgi:3-phosphoglycerate kinase